MMTFLIGTVLAAGDDDDDDDENHMICTSELLPTKIAFTVSNNEFWAYFLNS